ncbi:MAG TPA: hypothetical protein VFS25_15325 [Chitinophaga sp.]|uniref:hypothetical protein n=1 Tax=Chitinophaga sp. TaxID=1869181 RepID=UPI002DC00218|nr:hypothetical protein [Chitinophaga sp.]HEU4554215.1 hypothetical protein [Chitinophaga sp.]
MKKILLLSAAVSLIFTACSKDSASGTKPTITFKSYSIPYIDSLTSDFDAAFQVTDGDGDIQNTFNFRIILDSDPTTLNDTVFEARQMPDIGAHKGSKVDAEVIYNLQGSDFKIYDPFVKPDSLRLQVFIMDDEGHSSDTITTPKLGIIKE